MKKLSVLIFGCLFAFSCKSLPPPPPPSSGAELSGEVAYKGRYGDKGLAGATVEIRLKRGSVFRQVETDASGFFVFEEVPKGEFDLLVSRGEGYGKYSYNKLSDSGDWLNAENFPGGKKYLTVYLQGRHTVLRGKVVIAEDKMAIQGATVDTHPPTLEVRTDAEGIYVIESNTIEADMAYLISAQHPKFNRNGVRLETVRVGHDNEVPVIELGIRGKLESVKYDSSITNPSPGEMFPADK